MPKRRKKYADLAEHEQHREDAGRSTGPDATSAPQSPISKPPGPPPRRSTGGQQQAPTPDTNRRSDEQNSPRQATSPSMAKHLLAPSLSNPLDLTESNLGRHLQILSKDELVTDDDDAEEDADDDNGNDGDDDEEILGLMDDIVSPTVKGKSKRAGMDNEDPLDLSTFAAVLDERFEELESQDYTDKTDENTKAWVRLLREKKQAIVRNMTYLDELFNRFEAGVVLDG